MPPSAPSMTVFQRGGSFLHQRLTKLYSDTKQSYEKAAITKAPSDASIYTDPNVDSLRREFQIQQDRLLAWGLDWADTNAVQTQYQHGDVEIDKKLDNAGVGDVVADVMSEIQRLLNEAGEMQLPTKKFRIEGEFKKPVSADPDQTHKSWTWHEIAAFRALLNQLTTCLDVLYKLTESKRTKSQSSKLDAEKAIPKDNLPTMTASRSSSIKNRRISREPAPDRMEPSLPLQSPLPGSKTGTSPQHGHHINYQLLCLAQSGDPSDSGLPLYEEAMAHERSRIIGTLINERHNPLPIIVEFVSMAHDPEWADGAAGYLEQAWHTFSKVLPEAPLTHNGHAKLLGYTIDQQAARFGVIYQLPLRLEASTANPKTLSSLLSARLESSDASPSLEDRFRLAYNTLISQLGLLLEDGQSHGNLDSTNIVLFQLRHEMSLHIRDPYLFSHAKLFPPSNHFRDMLSSSIYRHPNESVADSAERRAVYEIYSLGLVLLEIGLWLPLSKFWKPKYDKAMFMKKIKHSYVQKLASRCGSAYMRVVMRCLNAPEDLGVGAEHMDKVMEHLQNISHELARCCAIDIDGAPTSSDFDYLEAKIAQRRKSKEPGEDSLVDAPMTPDSLNDEPDHSEMDLEQTTAQPEPKPQRAAALRKWTNIDIPQADLDEWNTQLMPRISRLLQNALQGSPASCSASLMMVGESPRSAKTTICIQCPDVGRVRKALQAGFRARKGWGVVVMKGEVRRSGKKKAKEKSAPYQGTQGATAKQRSSYQKKPSCGASIGAFKDSEHLPPVSYGGTILVDGQPFGMTVHHMLDIPSEDEEDEAEVVERCAAPRRATPECLQQISPGEVLPEFAEALDISEDEEDDSDSSTIRPDYAAFDDDGNEFWFLEDAPSTTPELDDSDFEQEYTSSEEEDDDDGDTRSVGDVVGVDPYDEDELLVTQPAIDDVEDDFFPTLEDKDDEHLDSHSLGYVHASSGIRRLALNGIKHEIDWALIKIQEERLHIGNSVKQEIAASRKRSKAKKPNHREPGSHLYESNSPWTAHDAGSSHKPTHPRQAREEQMALHLSGVAPLEKLAGSEVYCCGRTSGFRKGRISRAMTLVKMHGRESFSSSWCVEGGFGVPGDSGAWIYNPTTLQLCGHVLAWGNRSKTAYIAPMEVLFEDIRRTLGAGEVCLPAVTVPAYVEEEARCETALATQKQEPQYELQSASLNQQLEASREVELALKEMQINRELGMDRHTTPMRPEILLTKDVPNSLQSAKKRLQADHGPAVENRGTVR